VRTKPHGRDRLDRTLQWLPVTPTSLVVIGLACGLATPFVAQFGGRWLFAATILVVVTFFCDRWYPAVLERVGKPTRRSLVFVPVVARLVEVAWLYGFWRLGVPAGVVIAAGAISLLHEYIRSRAQIAGLREIAIPTLGERASRNWSALAGYGVGGVIALASTSITEGMATGIVTIAAIAWLLLGILGFVQLMIVVSAALRNNAPSSGA